MEDIKELAQLMEQMAFEIQRLRRDTAQAVPMVVSPDMANLLGRGNEIVSRYDWFRAEELMLHGGDIARFAFVKAVMFDSIRPAERLTYESDYDLFLSRLPYVMGQHVYHWPIKGVSEEPLPETELGLYMTESEYVFQVRSGHSRDAGILRIGIPGVGEGSNGSVSLRLRLQATLEPGQPWYTFYDKTQIKRMCDLDYVLTQVYERLGRHCEIDRALYDSLTASNFLAALQDAYVACGDNLPFPVRTTESEEIKWEAFHYRSGKPRMIPYILQAAPNEELGTPGFTQPCYAYYTGNREVYTVRNSVPPLDGRLGEVRMIADFLYALRIGPNQEFYQLVCGLLSRHATESPQLPPCSLVKR